MYPFSGGSGGSTTAASVSPAIRVDVGQGARRAVRESRAGARRRAVERSWLTGGRIHVKATRRRGWRGRTPASCSAPSRSRWTAQWEEGLSSSGTSGVQFAEVTVDIETGIVKVKRILAMQDCGLIVDKLTAESQVHGGIIGSINFALFEDRILDRVTGQMVNPNMEWYLLAGMSDVPKIDVILNNMPERGRHRHRRAADRVRPRRRSPTRCGTPPARRFAACRCTRTRFSRRLEQEKAGGTL